MAIEILTNLKKKVVLSLRNGLGGYDEDGINNLISTNRKELAMTRAPTRTITQHLSDLVDALGDEEYLNPMGHKMLVCQVVDDAIETIERLQDEIEVIMQVVSLISTNRKELA